MLSKSKYGWSVARGVLLRVLLLCTAAVLSLWLTKLALFAAVGTLLGFVALPANHTSPLVSAIFSATVPEG